MTTTSQLAHEDEMTIKSLANNKVPGIDEISTELLKHGQGINDLVQQHLEKAGGTR